MSNISVIVKRVQAVEAHPEHAHLQVAIVDGERIVVPEAHRFEAGDLTFVLPADTILPLSFARHVLLYTKGWGDWFSVGNPNQLVQPFCYPLVVDGAGVGMVNAEPDEPMAYFFVREGDDVAATLTLVRPPLEVRVKRIVAIEPQPHDSYREVLVLREDAIPGEERVSVCKANGYQAERLAAVIPAGAMLSPWLVSYLQSLDPEGRCLVLGGYEGRQLQLPACFPALGQGSGSPTASYSIAVDPAKYGFSCVAAHEGMNVASLLGVN